MNHAYYFSFEKLDAYQLAVSVCRRVREMNWPSGSSHLGDQAVRAADSVVLNLSEGWERGRHTKAAKNHFRIAKGSAGEVFSCLHILGVEDLADDLRRLGAMLGGMAR